MNYTDYQSFSLSKALEHGTYSDDYAQYIKLNNARSSRVAKTVEILPELQNLIENLTSPLDWHLITEPWCGDAAQSVPVIAAMAHLNPMIRLHVHLRDMEPDWIEKYLTEGSKSIPILVVRQVNAEKDILVWGPRPQEAQALMKSLKLDSTQTKQSISEALQRWYIEDKSKAIQVELFEALTTGLKTLLHAHA
jgi:hypothetical protein